MPLVVIFFHSSRRPQNQLHDATLFVCVVFFLFCFNTLCFCVTTFDRLKFLSWYCDVQLELTLNPLSLVNFRCCFPLPRSILSTPQQGDDSTDVTYLGSLHVTYRRNSQRVIH
ncbi:hypothetical protein TRVL_08363 [Trypanosoma vivax]|nr:hypothetical protein TRVL_08363 [Trypanosoma vivax]